MLRRFRPQNWRIYSHTSDYPMTRICCTQYCRLLPKAACQPHTRQSQSQGSHSLSPDHCLSTSHHQEYSCRNYHPCSQYQHRHESAKPKQDRKHQTSRRKTTCPKTHTSAYRHNRCRRIKNIQNIYGKQQHKKKRILYTPKHTMA